MKVFISFFIGACLFLVSCEYENKDEEISSAYDKVAAKSQNLSNDKEEMESQNPYDDKEIVETPDDSYPECSYPPTFPCLDSSSGLVWTFKSSEKMTWENAFLYCRSLNEGGYSDWRLPNIDELRTLIQNCSDTQTGGQCKVSAKNRCLSPDCSSSNCFCETDNSGRYSKFGDSDYGLWSSSLRTDYAGYAWIVDFSSAGIGLNGTDSHNVVRCVR